MATPSEGSGKSVGFSFRVKDPNILTKWMLDSTKVTFGPGAAVFEIMTSLESISIAMAVGSHSINRNDLEALCQQLPGVPSFILDTNQRHHRLIFSNMQNARAAFGTLQGMPLCGEPVTCHLDLNPLRQSASFEYCLQLSWIAPFKRFIAHMRSKHEVSNAIDAWKMKNISGVRLRVYRPTTNHLDVIVDGIPLNIPHHEIQSLFPGYLGEIVLVGVEDTTAEGILR
ncbi:9886_t:CDS:1, partial [Acaulospora colombiana]